jgi:hypothetical protein
LFNANTYLMVSGSTGGYFGLGAEGNALPHTWSLSIEEQFYLVFPAFIALGWALGKRWGLDQQRLVGAVLASLVAFSFLLSWLLTNEHLNPSGLGAKIAFYSAPTRAWEFAAGGLLVLMIGRRVPVGPRLATVGASAGVALLFFAAIVFSEATQFPGVAALVPVAGAMLLLTAGSDPDSNVLSHMLGSRLMRKIGDISYSWYLWHWPLIVFAAALFPGVAAAKIVAAALSLVPSWLSYHLVENPIRHRRDPPPRRTVTLAALCVLAPLLAAAGLNTIYQQVRLSSTPLARLAFHADYERGCNTWPSLGAQPNDNCRWPAPQSTGVAVLVGDSNAGHFTEGFVAASNKVGLDAVVATKYGCPWVDLGAERGAPANNSCRRFVDQTVADLLIMRPDVVVILTASDVYVKNFTLDVDASLQSGEASLAVREANAVAWENGISRIIKKLGAAEIQVVIVQPIPRFPQWLVSGMSPARLLGPTSWSNATINRDTALSDRSLAVEAQQRAATATGARTLDLFLDLCPNVTCSAFEYGNWLYSDGGHVSVVASELLAPAFMDALAT